jgi:phosphatidylserine/phosphatidylglycerophosphate/cardiolipin synthase-like enzyme
MKKGIFYFFIPAIFIGIGFYYLNHAQPQPKNSRSIITPVFLPDAKEAKSSLSSTSVLPLQKKPLSQENKQNKETEKRKNSTRLYPFFSPKDNIREIIINFIKKEQKTINCAAFRLTDPAITKELLEAQERGIKINLVIDKEGLSALHSKSLYLFTKGISIFVYPPILFDRTSDKQKREGLMHNKFICFESQETVITGSFNYTKSAQEINQENILVVEAKDIYETYTSHFEYLKTISSPLKEKQGELKKISKKFGKKVFRA